MLEIAGLKLQNPLVMAPMAGITNLPFRLIVKKKGAALVFTEMVSAAGLTLGQKKTMEYLKSHPDERPLGVQLFGSTPEIMAGAARMVVEAGADLVDINMGCPAKKVVKTGAGGALLRSPDRVKEILNAVRPVCPVPLTVKMRAGWSPYEPAACDLASLIEDCGVDALTLHPRYVTQKFSGPADWSLIRKVKERVTIPCIGNGDVFSPSLALDLMHRTGCDGVMIGRGAVGNPWIFTQILQLQKRLSVAQPSLDERKALILEHFRLLAHAMGQPRAARAMRGLLLWYTKGLPRSTRFRGATARIKDKDSLMLALDEYFTTLERKDP